jgi:hypothetical protein
MGENSSIITTIEISISRIHQLKCQRKVLCGLSLSIGKVISNYSNPVRLLPNSSIGSEDWLWIWCLPKQWKMSTFDMIERSIGINHSEIQRNPNASYLLKTGTKLPFHMRELTEGVELWGVHDIELWGVHDNVPQQNVSSQIQSNLILPNGEPLINRIKCRIRIDLCHDFQNVFDSIRVNHGFDSMKMKQSFVCYNRFQNSDSVNLSFTHSRNRLS